MDNPAKRIHRVSRFFRWLFQIWFWLLPVGFAVYWWQFNWIVGRIQIPLPLPVPLPLPAPIRLAAFLVTLIAVSFKMRITWLLVRLFRLYEGGQFFSASNVSVFRHLGWTLVLLAPAEILTQMLLTLVLSFQLPQRSLSLSLSSNQLTLLVTGGIVLLISWVLSEAWQLKIENDLTV